MIDELEKRGLVIRAPGKLDRRAKIVSSTPEGAALFRQAEAAARAQRSAALTGLSATGDRDTQGAAPQGPVGAGGLIPGHQRRLSG